MCCVCVCDEYDVHNNASVCTGVYIHVHVRFVKIVGEIRTQGHCKWYKPSVCVCVYMCVCVFVCVCVVCVCECVCLCVVCVCVCVPKGDVSE